MSFSSRGSITLETAVTFSIAIVFIASIASIVNFYRTDIIIKRAAAQVCEKNTLVMPLSVTASDYMSTAINAFPDLGIDNSDSAKVISTVAQIMTGADIAGGYSVEMLVSEEIYGGHIADDISDYYVEHNGGSDFFLPDVIDVSLEYDRDNNCIGVYVEYSIVTMVGHIGRCVYDVIPVYGSNDMFFNAAQSPDDSGDIWEKNNFDRGDSFREIYGSNLPKTFPVIDSYSAGEATSLVSMDLTAPTYQSSAGITESVYEHIDDLAEFESTSVRIDGRNYSAGPVSSRNLTVIIPGNSPDSARAALDSAAGYASSRGVTLNVQEYGTSDKYSH